ncbi:P-loop containing nucleoside triphosphate hydrolase protein [Flammula alnicola]|nr:P-loop containing nucleoside triphosphate hydrolase protein [Flammula alnicola]
MSYRLSESAMSVDPSSPLHYSAHQKLNVHPSPGSDEFNGNDSNVRPFPGSPGSDECDGDSAGIGLSHPQVNSGIRKKLDAMNKLQNTGVQVDIDLPQIAVIGSQSAGKSSLIESISGITLPRAIGTCTRCPTECRLSRSDAPWQCVVSLHFITDPNGLPLGQARNEQFGDTIYDKAKVEERIRRAQHAILNPSKPTKSFLEEDEDDIRPQLTFSTNCVTLQISGPDVADLSFCDLPGLIASVSGSEGSHDNSIALVESLVTAYIKKPSCIIILTVACETDFENQGAHRLAKRHDPDGKRTIGVLTKPDRIPLGEESSWLPFIRNEKEPLENNWFCVKQPSSNDLKSKITWAQARQMETDFFSTAPWSDLEEIYRKYLGTGNLVERLSNMLSDLISMRMPQIQDELERSIVHTRELLSRLPPAPSSDPRSGILTLLHKFAQDLGQQIEGVPNSIDDSDVGLIQAIRPQQEKFRRAIRATAPNFRPFERNARVGKHLPNAEFLRAEEGNECDGEASDSEGEVGTTASPFSFAAANKATKVKTPPPSGNKIYIDEVLERAHGARTRELPGHYPFVVQKTFIESIVKEWHAPSTVLCRTVHSTTSDHVKKLIHKHFGQFGQGYLEQRVRAIAQQHINECLERAEERIKWLQRLEDVPFSLNTHYLSDYKSKFLAHYRGARAKYMQNDLAKYIEQYKATTSQPTQQPFVPAPAPAPSPTPSPFPKTFKSAFAPAPATPAFPTSAAFAPVLGTTQPNFLAPQIHTGFTKVLGGLAEIGMTGVKPEDLQKLLPPDRMEPALVIMADVRAYFQVAYKRFADNIPLAIDFELVRGVERDLLPELYTHLGINGPNGDAICKDLAQESRKTAERRLDLHKKLERLESARLELFIVAV